MIGVDYGLFWSLNPKSLQPFIKAFSLKQKVMDSYMWSQGLYIQMAIASCFNKHSKYPTKPLSNNNSNVMSGEEIKAKMLKNVEVINKHFRKEVNDV